MKKSHRKVRNKNEVLQWNFVTEMERFWQGRDIG
jgi:hypothetical protein